MQDLAKALHPAVIENLASANQPHGPTVVRVRDEANQTIHPDLQAHLAAHFAKPEEEFADGLDRGIQTKRVVDTGQHRFLLKPYFEAYHPAREAVPGYKGPSGTEPGQPAQPAHGPVTTGWAEMTNQALYHAAGIGHLHQQVHVVNLPDRGQDQPMLAIRMSPEHEELQTFQWPKDEMRAPENPNPAWGTFGAQPRPAFSAKQETTVRQAAQDAGRMAVMDWLVQNSDRHHHNVMITPDHRLLAIDHGRTLAYAPKSWDPEPDQYLKGTALGDVHQQAKGLRPEERQGVMDWWRQASPAVRRTFEQRLRMIKHATLRRHLRENFEARAGKLDEAAAAGDDPGFWGAYHYPSTLPGLPVGSDGATQLTNRAHQA